MTLQTAPPRAEAATMQAVVYRGYKSVRTEPRPKPALVEPGDAIVRVTCAGICGSDLHLYHYYVPGFPGRVGLGHEAVGIVEAVGEGVTTVAEGDRVVVSGLIACGTCWFCREGHYSQCDVTNPSRVQETLWGHHKAALYGLGPIMGPNDGCQAEHARVPFADVNLLPIPDTVPDDVATLLSDVLPIAWMGAEMAGAGPGKTIAVWGCGPVGLLAMECARAMGVERLIAVDNVPYRLDVARARVGAETVNFDETRPVPAIRALTGGRGPDGCIEAVGFRCASSMHHRVQQTLKLETDAIDSVTEAMRAVRKAGTVAVIGAFVGYANQFPMGALMEKALTLKGGTAYVQRYWRDLLARIEDGTLDPGFVITHRMPLAAAAEAYRMFDRKEQNALKVVLTP